MIWIPTESSFRGVMCAVVFALLAAGGAEPAAAQRRTDAAGDLEIVRVRLTTVYLASQVGSARLSTVQPLDVSPLSN